MRIWRLICLTILLSACGGGNSGGQVNVAFIGNPDGALDAGLRLSYAAQHVRGATSEGLVAMNERGETIPAIAERWIVTDDGQNYIFRLRRSDWPDGTPITSRSARSRLNRIIQSLDGTSLGRDLNVVDDVIARAGSVLEIQLSSPMPEFLQLLAQAELGLVSSSQGTGPMRLAADAQSDAITFEAVAPSQRGLPQGSDWQDDFLPVSFNVTDGATALALFEDAEVDLVLNGRLAHLPSVDTGPLSRGTLRLDGALGLFGLRVLNERGFLSSAERRGALSMAIDRETLLQPFNIGGWTPETRIVPGAAAAGTAPPPRWAQQDMETRISAARAQVAAWELENGAVRPIRIRLPEGPGMDQLLLQIARAWDAIGIEVVRAGNNVEADMTLVDRAARYSSPRWFLNQLACPLRGGLCSPVADSLIAEALTMPGEGERTAAMAEAEQILLNEHVFIPFGAPIRWSLVRGEITGFSQNAWGVHPLFPLSRRPT